MDTILIAALIIATGLFLIATALIGIAWQARDRGAALSERVQACEKRLKRVSVRPRLNRRRGRMVPKCTRDTPTIPDMRYWGPTQNKAENNNDGR